MHGRSYAVELGTAILAYCCVLALVIPVTQTMPPGLLRACVAVTPMVPAIGIGWAIIRHLRRIDEFQRRLQLEALALAFAGTGFISFSYGFLEQAGLPKLSMFCVWPLMATLWVAGLALCHRRYR